MRSRSNTHILFLLAAASIAALLIVPTTCLRAQSFGTAVGLLQGEHLARSSTLYSDTLKAGADTTAWIAFGTHAADLAAERPYAASRFTLFVKLDTAGVAHAADPQVSLHAQVALDDTATAYIQEDGSLTLAPASNPVTSVDPGSVLPVPVYGGGWLRFIVEAEDTVAVRLDLWRTR